MRVRLLSPYPLIVAADTGRPIDPPAIVEIPDGLARALEAQYLLEAAPGQDVTVEADVMAWGVAGSAAPAAEDPVPPAVEPAKPKRR